MRANPLLRFSVLSALCIVLLGLVLAHVLAQGIRDRALVDARETAQLLGDEAVRPLLRPGDFAGRPISAPRRARLDAVARDAKRDGRLIRLKVWSSRGVVVYSDDPAVIGKRFPVGGELADAVRGRPFVSVEEEPDAGQRRAESSGQLVEAYVPLRLRGEDTPTGAFEIYAPYGPIAAAIARDRRMLLLVLAGGLVVLWLVLFRIVAGASRALRDQAAASRHEADHDLLTGLPNRRVLQERLDAAITRARRETTSCALLIVDLDGFKELNDTLGHPAGDELLRELGPRLARVLDDDAVLARLGGDEFAAVLGDRSAPDDVGRVSRALLAALEEPFALDGLQVRIAASIGVARFPEHGEDAAALMRRADVAMYQAKRARTGCEEYSLERDGHSRERLALAEELRRGLERCELEVFYQPQSQLPSGRVAGVEALIRWHHPVHGLLTPGEFLFLAEQSGLSRPLTSYVLERALEQLSAWTALGLDLTVAVNLAVPDLLDARLVDEVAGHLARSGVAPHRLVLEITEDVVMTDPQRCADVLFDLAALGVSLALDDFGTGYSSLTHLKALPVDVLKIDRSFVTRMGTNERDSAIVRSLVELARALGLRVIAEGIEDGETMDRLSAFGCDAAQGFHLSRPVPALQLTPLLMAAAGEPQPAAA